MKQYQTPSLTEYGSISVLTGFSGNSTEQDVIISPAGQFGFPGPASEFACEIPGRNADTCL
jgi:hypothetical protein